jgi:hypothetical protein
MVVVVVGKRVGKGMVEEMEKKRGVEAGGMVEGTEIEVLEKREMAQLRVRARERRMAEVVVEVRERKERKVEAEEEVISQKERGKKKVEREGKGKVNIGRTRETKKREEEEEEEEKRSKEVKTMLRKQHPNEELVYGTRCVLLLS